MARPTDYRRAYCESVIALGREGKSKAQIAAALGVSRQTLENWSAVNPEFLDALGLANDLALAWWEDKAQDSLTADKFQASLWSRSMAARFPADYREKASLEHTGPNGGPVQIDRIERVLVRGNAAD